MADLALLRPGRHGRADGAPGVVVTPITDIALAAISVRAGTEPVLAERMMAAIGVAPPARPACAMSGSAGLVWSGPGQWLALRRGLAGAARHCFAQDLAGVLGSAASVTEMTGSRSILRLSGPYARDALAKIVPVDLDEAAFPAGAAALTNGGYMPLQIWRLPADEPVFELACYRSYGDSLADAVLQAAREHGCEVLSAA
ncbi:sarcosine oxidase subunit gamma [Falsiroseomonas oryziterrae]|uniref:sarcosine oxidase subunit gamma n=1 Tax=Falsiroseomonas oryziterrae TaxID=2911368 RepID=UPI001F332ACB|nr:sarcosine oxidase subunit gamma family protein [Roseomonas sp. NPKOSM-4]